MSTQQFNATNELNSIRNLKLIRRRKVYAKSRLLRYHAELIAMHEAKASYREITLWLRRNKRIKISHTSVMRYLNKIKPVQEGSNA